MEPLSNTVSDILEEVLSDKIQDKLPGCDIYIQTIKIGVGPGDSPLDPKARIYIEAEANAPISSLVKLALKR